jgi:hypothetical protein
MSNGREAGSMMQHRRETQLIVKTITESFHEKVMNDAVALRMRGEILFTSYREVVWKSGLATRPTDSSCAEVVELAAQVFC